MPGRSPAFIIPCASCHIFLTSFTVLSFKRFASRLRFVMYLQRFWHLSFYISGGEHNSFNVFVLIFSSYYLKLFFSKYPLSFIPWPFMSPHLDGNLVDYHLPWELLLWEQSWVCRIVKEHHLHYRSSQVCLTGSWHFWRENLSLPERFQ